MRYIQMGGRKVSVIGLGTWQFGSPEWGWGRDFGPEDARQVVHRALDLGINFFDTAEMYGRGRSEAILGEALSQRDDDAVVATKVWVTRLTAGAVVEAAEQSLRRLGRPAIDLYQVHWPNPLVPLSWTIGGMRRLLDSGTVRAIGVSNFSLGRWQKSERLLGQPVVSNQVPYHLLRSEVEDKLLPYATKANRIIIAYSPLGQGLFSGAFTPGYRPAGARVWTDLFEPRTLLQVEPLLEVLRSVAAAHGATPAQIALAWTLRSGQVVAIPGARRVWQVEENAAAAEIDLGPTEVEAIHQAARQLQPSRRLIHPRLFRLVAGALAARLRGAGGRP